ncbi:MAG: tyrosine-type recombinase/integrase [Ignavibacteria bacterium]|jgi:integrase
MRSNDFDYDMLAEKLFSKFKGRKEEMTLQRFCDEYMVFVKRNRAPKTYEGAELICKKLLSYFSPKRMIDTIKLKEAEDFLESLKQNAPKGIYNYYRTLRAMWNKGIQWNYLQENPFDKVKLKKRQLQNPVYVTEQQLEEIVTNIDSEDVRDAVVFAFYTGCRLGEIVTLTWQDVKLKDDLIIIGNKDFETKGRKQRVVPIHPKVKEILLVRGKKLEIRSKERYVFCKSNCYPYTGDYFSRRFKRACRGAGIDEEIHFHCLRHGAATRMIMNGAPLPSVQKILGHANIQTTMIYTHPDIESLKEAVAKL